MICLETRVTHAITLILSVKNLSQTIHLMKATIWFECACVCALVYAYATSEIHKFSFAAFVILCALYLCLCVCVCENHSNWVYCFPNGLCVNRFCTELSLRERKWAKIRYDIYREGTHCVDSVFPWSFGQWVFAGDSYTSNKLYRRLCSCPLLHWRFRLVMADACLICSGLLLGTYSPL